MLCANISTKKILGYFPHIPPSCILVYGLTTWFTTSFGRNYCPALDSALLHCQDFLKLRTSTSPLKSVFKDATSLPTHLSFLVPLNPALDSQQSHLDDCLPVSPQVHSYFGGIERGIKSHAGSGAHRADAGWIHTAPPKQALGMLSTQGGGLEGKPWPQAGTWYVWKEREFPKPQWFCSLAGGKVNKILKVRLREANGFLLALVFPQESYLMLYLCL